MSINSITEDTIEHCCANCGAPRELQISDLTLGVLTEGHLTPNIIALPPCESCPSVEYLIIPEDDTETPSETSSQSQHLVLVHALKTRLLALGLVESMSEE